MAHGLPHLELFCFGSATARLGSREPPAMLLWTKHLGLLIYLALSPARSRTRDHLLGLFWADKPEARARHSLNETLRRLRKILGAERLLSRGDAVVLNDAGLEVDAWRDEALAEPAGAFLEGFVVDEAPGFEEWAAGERRRYQARIVAALVAAGEPHLRGSRFVDAAGGGPPALTSQPPPTPAGPPAPRPAAAGGRGSGVRAQCRRTTTLGGAGCVSWPGRGCPRLRASQPRRPTFWASRPGWCRSWPTIPPPARHPTPPMSPPRSPPCSTP